MGNAYSFVGSSAINGMDPLGLRKFTDAEVQLGKDVYALADAMGGQVGNDIKKFVDALKDQIIALKNDDPQGDPEYISRAIRFLHELIGTSKALGVRDFAVLTETGIVPCKFPSLEPPRIPEQYAIWIEESSPHDPADPRQSWKQNEPTAHLSLSIGDPLGTYYSWSFAAVGFSWDYVLTGEVYEDTIGPGRIQAGYFYWISQEDAQSLIWQLGDIEGKQGYYRLINGNCRQWSYTQFDIIVTAMEEAGRCEKGTPPARQSRQRDATPTLSPTTQSTEASVGCTSSSSTSKD